MHSTPNGTTQSRLDGMLKRSSYFSECPYYPITMVMTAFERANLPGVSSRGNLPSPTAQETTTRESFTPVAEVVPPLSTDPMKAQPEVSGRLVLLNPGSAEQ